MKRNLRLLVLAFAVLSVVAQFSDCIDEHGPDLEEDIYGLAEKAADEQKEDLIQYALRFNSLGMVDSSEKECKALMRLKKHAGESKFLDFIEKEAAKRGIENPLEESTAVFVHSMECIEAVDSHFETAKDGSLQVLKGVMSGAQTASHVRRYGQQATAKLMEFMRKSSSHRYHVQKLIKSGAQWSTQISATAKAVQDAAPAITKTVNARLTRSMAAAISEKTGYTLDGVRKIAEQISKHMGTQILNPKIMAEEGPEMARRAVGAKFGIKHLTKLNEALGGGMSTISALVKPVGTIAPGLARQITKYGPYAIAYADDFWAVGASFHQAYSGQITTKMAIKEIAKTGARVAGGVAGGFAGSKVGEQIGQHFAGTAGAIGGNILGGIGGSILGRLAGDYVATKLMDSWLQLTPSTALNKAYEELGVPSSASNSEINGAFRKLALQHHPDKPGGDKEKMENINIAMEIIKTARLQGEIGTDDSEEKTEL